MMRSRLLRATTATAIIASMAAPSTATTLAPPRGDGRPTPEACAELGFRNYARETESSYGSAYAGSPVINAPTGVVAPNARDQGRGKHVRREMAPPPPPPSAR